MARWEGLVVAVSRTIEVEPAIGLVRTVAAAQPFDAARDPLRDDDALRRQQSGGLGPARIHDAGLIQCLGNRVKTDCAAHDIFRFAEIVEDVEDVFASRPRNVILPETLNFFVKSQQNSGSPDHACGN